jgi:putative ABC transport system permease protein
MLNIFRSELTSRYDEFKNRLLENSQVLNVTTSEDVLGSKCQTNPFKPEGATDYQQFQRLMVGYDFVETFKLELLAGRSFNKSYPTDDSLAVLVNEAMLRHLEWGTPQEALGKGFTGRRRTQVIVGVLKDFHFTSLHTPIEPFVLDIADTENQHNFFDRYLAVRIAPDHFPETIAFLEKTWAAFMPDRPFEYFFMDDEHEKLYLAEEKLGIMAETRTREIGIRKVLGATTSGIVGLLSKEFLALVLIALIIASPLAYFLMTRWLQDFASRTDIGWWVFVMAGVVALLVAFLTVSFQSVRAALANPVKSLRSE